MLGSFKPLAAKTLQFSVFGYAAPTRCKKGIGFGGMDDAIDIDPFVGTMDVFRHGTITGGLRFAKEMKGPQIGGAGGDGLGRIIV